MASNRALLPTVAIVGLGPWGQNLLRAFLRRRDCRVVALCDSRAERLERASRLVHVPAYAKFEQLLGDRALDAIVIATAAQQHARLASLALSAEKHVFVEKPMALTLSEARALAETAACSKGTLMVGHILRYHPATEAMQAVVRSGMLGEIRLVASRRLGAQPRRDVDVWWNLGSHDISLFRFLVGEQAEVLSLSRGLNEQGGERVQARLAFGKDVRAILDFGTEGPKVRELALVGTRGMLLFDDLRSKKRLVLHQFDDAHAARQFERVVTDGVWSRDEPQGVGSTRIAVSPRPPLDCEVEHFVECVVTGQTPRTDALEGTAVVAVLEAGRRKLSRGGSGRFAPAGSHSITEPAQLAQERTGLARAQPHCDPPFRGRP